MSINHDQLMSAHKWILRRLSSEMNFRPDHHDWIERERMAVAVAANEWASANGLSNTVTIDEVEAIEQRAVGHYDYATKLALYVAERIHGL